MDFVDRHEDAMSSERMTAEQIREEAARKAGGWIGPLALILPMTSDVFRDVRDSLVEMHVAYMTELDAARRLGVEATKDAITTSAEASALRAERDTLAAVLAEVREKGSALTHRVEVVAENPALHATTRDDMLRLAGQLAHALSALPADLAAERDARVRAEAVEEREVDMHARIRAEYDRTIADSWRAANAKLADERDAAIVAREAAEAGRAALRGTLVLAGDALGDAGRQLCGTIRADADGVLRNVRASVAVSDALRNTAAAAEAWTRETRAKAHDIAADKLEERMRGDRPVLSAPGWLRERAAAIREGRE